MHIESKKEKILGFFHIATILTHKNRWNSIAAELMIYLNRRKLLSNTDLLTKVYLGPEAYKFENETKQNIKTISAGDHLDLYEGPTLRELWRACNATDEEFYVYYIHTKGVSYPPNTKSEPWRRHMVTAVLLNWEKCIKILDDGAKTCGIMWREDKRISAHYSGNFWWAKASYIRTLEKPESNSRMYFEQWLSPKQTVLEGYPNYPSGRGVAL